MMILRVLSTALVLSVGFSSYCYSETIETGITNNAAANGLTWDMNNILPPDGILTVNNVYYRYTIEKDQQAGAQVHIRNINPIDGGYTFDNTDNWDGLPGSTINKIIPVDNIPREYWGDGSITVEGDATISDPTVAYGYKVNLCKANALYSPECPGYLMALYQWLLDNGLIGKDVDPDDPLLEQYIQEALDDLSDTDKPEELQETKAEEEEEQEQQSMEDKLAVGGAAEKIANAAQQTAMLKSLATVPAFEKYYTPMIPGGVYNDTIELQDGEISDNRSALRNLAQDSLHRDMVRSQYDNIKQP